MSNKILPITEYPHTDGIAVIGGYVYKGTAIPSLANKYIFADLTGQDMEPDRSARQYLDSRRPALHQAAPSHLLAVTPPESFMWWTTTAAF